MAALGMVPVAALVMANSPRSKRQAFSRVNVLNRTKSMCAVHTAT